MNKRQGNMSARPFTAEMCRTTKRQYNLFPFPQLAGRTLIVLFSACCGPWDNHIAPKKLYSYCSSSVASAFSFSASSHSRLHSERRRVATKKKNESRLVIAPVADKECGPVTTSGDARVATYKALVEDYSLLKSVFHEEALRNDPMLPSEAPSDERLMKAAETLNGLPDARFREKFRAKGNYDADSKKVEVPVSSYRKDAKKERKVSVDERIEEVISRVFQFPSLPKFVGSKDACRLACVETFGCVAYNWAENSLESGTKRTSCTGVRGEPPALFVKLLREKLEAGKLNQGGHGLGSSSLLQQSTSSDVISRARANAASQAATTPPPPEYCKSSVDSFGTASTSCFGRCVRQYHVGTSQQPQRVLCDAGDSGFDYEVLGYEEKRTPAEIQAARDAWVRANPNWAQNTALVAGCCNFAPSNVLPCERLYSWRSVLHVLTRPLAVAEHWRAQYPELLLRRVTHLTYAQVLQSSIADASRHLEDNGKHYPLTWVAKMQVPGAGRASHRDDDYDADEDACETKEIESGMHMSHQKWTDAEEGLRRAVDDFYEPKANPNCYEQCKCHPAAVTAEKNKASEDDFTKERQPRKVAEFIKEMQGGDSGPQPNTDATGFPNGSDPRPIPTPTDSQTSSGAKAGKNGGKPGGKGKKGSGAKATVYLGSGGGAGAPRGHKLDRSNENKDSIDAESVGSSQTCCES